ncbi:MAG TPA: (2Fe-2S)-binding protein [Actinophytocola sp.]|uniref:(2Fe-2S)-binding protein n=1 Tax=Actinophytocola sp. TaxID=1872138 RepID=UPI002DBFEB24|nr:(2Fe-2S)-binding protein [Actinophytocola sp.]HEU5470953.1 (2Fe-2S)-binding protein [Actinophytocola sp.]
MTIGVTVNGKLYQDECDSVSLLVLLRDHWRLLGTKNACAEGECGSCTVLLDGELVNACLVLAAQADGREVTTVEGLADGDRPNTVQQAFLDAGAVQCGFCTPGMVLAVSDLLRRTPDPTEAQARRELAGNLCRCTGYQHILDAVRLAAEREAGAR